jgi:hypothetical protein
MDAGHQLCVGEARHNLRQRVHGGSTGVAGQGESV